MDSTRQYYQQQEAKRLHDRIASFVGDCKIGTLLNNSGIRKLRGVRPMELFTVIFMLPFQGVNLAQGIAGTPALNFHRDAVHDFLKNPRHNWQKFMLSLVELVVRFFDVLTDEQGEKVLTVDDSTYDQSC